MEYDLYCYDASGNLTGVDPMVSTENVESRVEELLTENLGIVRVEIKDAE